MNKFHWKHQQIYYGDKFTGWSIQTDGDGYMYRVRGPNGYLSDKVNLTRARDAAMARAQKEYKDG